jgi:hypothetical protein
MKTTAMNHSKALNELLEAARKLAIENLISDDKYDFDIDSSVDVKLIQTETARLLQTITDRLNFEALPSTQNRKINDRRRAEEASRKAKEIARRDRRMYL